MINLDKYNAVCFDLDGTVYRGIEPIPEAVTFINRLQKKGIEPFFITNNGSMMQAQFQEKLASFGIETNPDNIMTSAIAAAKYCKDSFDGAKVLMIGEKGLEEALKSAGIQLTDKNPDVVVMGIDREITYEKLALASLAIRAGAQFIATNSDLAYPTERGFLPGNGAFVKLMEATTGKTPIYIGKPEPHMLNIIQAQHGFSKEEMVLIGDNYDTDIQAGIRFGIDTIHVESGVTSREELLTKEVQPTFTLRTLSDWQI